MGKKHFWLGVTMSLLLRLLLILLPKNLNLGSRPEIATPVTSLRRLAEGYWLKQSSLSPYAGSMYHGSPLLLYILGPLTAKRSDGRDSHLCSLLFVVADLITAILIRAIGQKLQISYSKHLRSLNLAKLLEASRNIGSEDVAALVYLWNPLSIFTCVGSSTSPIDNLMVILSLYGACSRIAPLAAFGWVVATHLSLYPAILIVPVILLLGFGLDAPPKKLFQQGISGTEENNPSDMITNQRDSVQHFSWSTVIHFVLWVSIWFLYVLILCSVALKEDGGLWEMLMKTYGFILTVEDLSPNIGILWYFFAEVFDFFRVLFLIVFHLNILFMIIPLAIRLNHRPYFLAFVYIAISSMLKSYPSIGDTSLYLSLLACFINELAEMHFSFFLFCGYVGVFLLSPVMHNLWIWRGTGNANFYFATAIVYACLQIVLVVDSVGAMLNHDRMLRKQVNVMRGAT